MQNLFRSTHQFSHNRGNAAPVRASTAIMSARKRAASWAQNRAIAKPFQAEIPTSPENDSDASRIFSTNASSPGTINRRISIILLNHRTQERIERENSTEPVGMRIGKAAARTE